MTYIIGPRRGKIKSSKQMENPVEVELEGTSPEISEYGIYADFSLYTAKSTLFDAIVVPGGAQSINTLKNNGEAFQWINEAYKHHKTIGAVNEGVALLRESAIPPSLISVDESITTEKGVVTAGVYNSSKESESIVGNAIEAVKSIGKTGNFVKSFIEALGQHRHWERDVTRIPA